MAEAQQLKERLNHDLKDAMRAKDRTRLLAIRSLMSSITNREKEEGTALSADVLAAVVMKEAKQRRDAMSQYEDAGREDLAQQERDELAIIGRYLPRQLSDEEIRSIVQEIITRVGASSRNDLGRVMSEAMSELRGQADGNRVRVAVQGLLGD
jgi:uncharacterized protein